MSIEVKEISKKYGEQFALNKVSFEIKKGEIVGFLGPNGAGKSTTMKIICCYLNPTGGDVLVNGESIKSNPIKIKSELGYLPENNPLYEEMYVREFLSFIAQIHNIKDIKTAVDEVIKKVGLTKEAHKKIEQLSKGYQQRVGIAQAIIHEPKVLILDEPTSGLDPNQLDEIRSLIKELGKDKTVMLSTHIMQEVESICDRIIIINNGKLVADQELEQKNKTKEQKDQTIVVEFDKEILREQLLTIDPDLKLKKVENKWLISYNGADDLRLLISSFAQNNGFFILEIKKHSDKLEDLFKKLTK
jgi:ABC-2 type transport system ATP-binding protein